jgi:O-antigen ligase
MPLSLGTAAGLLIGAWFALLCRRNLPQAVVALVLLAWVPFIRVLPLEGERITQHLLLAQLLPTILIGVWWLGGIGRPRPPILPSALNAPLALLIAASVVSLVWNLGGADPNVPTENIKFAVSVGQVLLIVWPVGIYLVVANARLDTGTMQKIVRLVVLMALPAVCLPAVPAAWRPYLEWSVYFALVASPFCVAASFETRSRAKWLGCWVLALSPLVYGLVIGKAFLYVTTTVAVGIVVYLKERRTLLIAMVMLAGLYGLWAAVSGSFVPWPLEGLLDVERRQQSWGGRAGRVALAFDTLSVWARHPLFGVGPGNSWPYMHRYSVIDTPHNQYLNLLLELGVAGLCCAVWFIVAAVKMGLRAYASMPEGFHRTLTIGWLGYFGGMVVSALTGDFIFHSIRNGGLEMFTGYYLQWVLLGMVVRADALERGAQ